MSPTELVIVGAGPAGAAAAIHARDMGIDVVVVDKATFPRDKCCGDGLTTLALRELERLGLDPSGLPSWESVSEIALRSPAGREMTLPLPTNRGAYSAVVRRRELDLALVQLVRARGVEVREGGRGVGVEHHLRDGVGELRVDDGPPLLARHVIAADGMWSRVRKSLGETLPSYRGDWHALRQYARADGERSRMQWVWFERDLLPGYAWSFPLADGRVNIGFGIVRTGRLDGKQLKRVWDGLVDRPHIRDVLGDVEVEDTVKAWPIPARLPDVSVRHGRVLFAGDAALVTDPMTGEGIGQALETGRLAAQAVAQGGPAGATGMGYDQTVRRNLETDHRLARRLSGLLARPRIAEAALRAVDLNGWTRRNFARWMFEDYPRAAIFTPRRWRRGMFDSPGGYADQPRAA